MSFNIQILKASGTTVYIRATGEVEGTDKIHRDGDFYIFTDIINDEITVERNNVIIDGAGYTLHGYGYESKGIYSQGTNITVRNMNINGFMYGVSFWYSSSNNTIFGNNITDTVYGIWIYRSSSNRIFGNKLTSNSYGIDLESSWDNTLYENVIAISKNGGIYSSYSSNNTISQNTITGVYYSWGIGVTGCSDNNVTDNTIVDTLSGIRLLDSSNNNIFHNNFVNNTEQVYSWNSTNVWDDGYPSGGNYWSDYAGTDIYNGMYQNETGCDWIGDNPQIIDENNRDNYPLMYPFALEMEEIRIAYRNLLLRITDLQGKYDSIQQQITSLNSTLTSGQEAIINELINIRNVMYIFIATTIIFIATAVYLAIRKPKKKP